ncbi:MAG: threonine--tRNA ligase [Proteobacteria bacterium]|nr:threonine--tRNA ligase [Pseudomonadota bacterium]
MKNDKNLEAIKSEELPENDHRRIGRELDLFSIDEYVGPGLALWHPNGAIVRDQIESFWKEHHSKHGYKYVYTPEIGLKQLFEKSGHLAHFADMMYPPMDMSLKDKSEQGAYYLKPMSCPFHVRIYNSSPHSYKELPIKYCELGRVYRYEASGGLKGLLRVRLITQDDAHIICRQDQFKDELSKVFDFGFAFHKIFGYDKFKVYLSLRDMANKRDKYIENEPVWEFAGKSIEEVLRSKKIPYDIDIGGAKFYGPAIDVMAIDNNGKEWQCMTIQLDLNLPEKWGMSYVGEDGQKHTPIMIHRAVLGAMERFIAVYLERCGGNLPVWLSPVQAKVLSVSDKHKKYAKQIEQKLVRNGIRAEYDGDGNTVGYQIRAAAKMKIPYVVIVGDKEMENKNISLRMRGGEQTADVKLSDFLKRIRKIIKDKSLDL